MKLFGNNRKESSPSQQDVQKDKKRPWWETLRFSRRKAIVGAVVTLVTVSTNTDEAVGGFIANKALDGIIAARDPVPPDLRQPTIINPGQEVELDGYGHSVMAGVGADNIPLVRREARHLASRGIAADAQSYAEPGSTVDQLPDQLARAKKKIKPKNGKHRQASIMTGGNELKDHPSMIANYEAVAEDPLDLARLGKLRDDAERLQQEFGESLQRNMKDIVTTTDADGVTAYRILNEQKAKDIQIIGSGGRQTEVPIGGNSLTAKIRQALVAYVVRRGNRAVDEAARKVRAETGKQVRVIDPADVITQPMYTDHQHPNATGADALAKESASFYEERQK